MVEVVDAQELLPGELASRAGVAISALHFYEREGLISSRRTSGNQRRYSRDTVRRVAFIRMSQRLGIPLSRIREALATLPTDRIPTSRDWARLSAGWRQDLDDRILHLERLRDNLAGCIGCGCLSLKTCALSNPGDMLADQGPGAVRLLSSTACAIDSPPWSWHSKARCLNTPNAATSAVPRGSKFAQAGSPTPTGCSVNFTTASPGAA